MPSSELAALRVQVRAQLNELMKRINGLLESRAAAARSAKFDTNGRAVEKSDEVNREFLNKALENGKRVDVSRLAAPCGRRFSEPRERRPLAGGTRQGFPGL